MSCIKCANKRDTGLDFACECDQFVHPIPLNIGAGLDTLPRQIATFPEFRRAMLHSIKDQEIEIIDQNNVPVKLKPLTNWRARDKDDLGIMLLEMWAYICDSLSFYDQVLANETYIRTSFLRPNLRKLVALLGYIPRPAVGSVVELAALADGRLQLKLPVGTAFRSGAFEGNPPQVFELDTDTFIHSLTNKFAVKAPHFGKISQNNPKEFLVDLKGEIKPDNLLLVINNAEANQNSGEKVWALEKYVGNNQVTYNKLFFNNPTKLLANAKLKDIQLLKPNLSAGLWTLNDTANTINANNIVLNVLSDQIKANEYILMAYQNQLRWYKIVAVNTVMKTTITANTMIINGNNFTIPGVQSPVTQLVLDVNVNDSARKKPDTPDWNAAYIGGITVFFGMALAGNIVDEPNQSLNPTDDLFIANKIERPIEDFTTNHFLLKDKNTFGVSVGGAVDYDLNKILLDQDNGWLSPLTNPVEAFGNVITATRGESVLNEKMGSGNAAIANQSFKLKKKPLTYHLSPTAGNDSGVKNTLTVHVDGIKWTEVVNFYGKTETDQIYIVRQNDEGESTITFGDGIGGQRLPSGVDNIICNYRFGAEAAVPPAGSVNQIAKPVKGLQSVKNVLAAYGGADAETEENLRTYAPKSALILGRVVSLADMEALTASFPGVRAVQTEWRWDTNKQKATAHIYYIGDAGLSASISQKVRAYADPTIPITVENAQSKPLSVSLNIKVDTNYLEKDVLSELRASLLYAKTGIFAPENIGIGKPLFRSKIFEAVLKIAGTETVQSILLNRENFSKYAVVPGIGFYFDIETAFLEINGEKN